MSQKVVCKSGIKVGSGGGDGDDCGNKESNKPPILPSGALGVAQTPLKPRSRS